MWISEKKLLILVKHVVNVDSCRVHVVTIDIDMSVQSLQDEVGYGYSEKAAELDASIEHESIVEKEVCYLERKVDTYHGHETIICSQCVELHYLLQDV